MGSRLWDVPFHNTVDVLGCIASPEISATVLVPSTYVCNFSSNSICRCDQIKVRSFGWALFLHKEEKVGLTPDVKVEAELTAMLPRDT